MHLVYIGDTSHWDGLFETQRGAAYKQEGVIAGAGFGSVNDIDAFDMHAVMSRKREQVSTSRFTLLKLYKHLKDFVCIILGKGAKR